MLLCVMGKAQIKITDFMRPLENVNDFSYKGTNLSTDQEFYCGWGEKKDGGGEEMSVLKMILNQADGDT